MMFLAIPVPLNHPRFSGTHERAWANHWPVPFIIFILTEFQS